MKNYPVGKELKPQLLTTGCSIQQNGFTSSGRCLCGSFIIVILIHVDQRGHTEIIAIVRTGDLGEV